MNGTNWHHDSSTVTLLDHLAKTPAGFCTGWLTDSNAQFASIHDAWTNDPASVILFTKVPIATTDLPAFIKRLKSYLRDPLRKSVRILYIENPNDLLSKWITYSLSVTGAYPNQKISALSYIDFKNYSLGISKNSEIELIADEFVITREPNNDEGFEWSMGYGRHRIYDLGPTIKIPITGELTGCLQFEIALKREDELDEGKQNGYFGYPTLTNMDVGMRIFFRDPDFPSDGDKFFLSYNRYPLFQERSDNDEAKGEYPLKILLQATIDPLFHLVEERSFFTFGAPEYEDKNALNNGIPSAYYTNFGFDVHLVPKGTDSQLVFASKPDQLTPKAIDEAPYYLIPKGKFSLCVPRYPIGGVAPSSPYVEKPNIDCGISGLEYIKIESDFETHFNFEIHFITRKPAYSGAFLSIRSLLRDFNLIQKKFQRTAYADPDDSKTPWGGEPRDLPESTDIDWEVEGTTPEEVDAKIPGLTGLNISDNGREAMLDYVLGNYFPSSASAAVGEKQRKAYLEIRLVEDWIQWFRDQIKEATILIAKKSSLMSGEITTSWTLIADNQPTPKPAIYFAQPDNAVLYLAEGSSNDFLDYMEVPTVAMPASILGTPEAAFPMLPYGNVDPGSMTDIRQMELLVINPMRRKLIQQIGKNEDFASALTDDLTGNRQGTTPQGLIATFSNDWKEIKELQIAKDTKGKKIGFTSIKYDLNDPLGYGAALKGAFQANQLFLVVSNPEALMAYFSNGALAGIPLENDLDIMDWVFELGPGYWNKHGTIMVFKYTNTSLLEMAVQPERWFMPNTFNSSPRQTSKSLQELLTQGIEFGNSLDEKEKLKYSSLAVAASQPNWTGILMLNVHVPLRGLPDSLKALAGGMNPDLFFANYLGVEVTQVKTKGTGSKIELDPQVSSIFALIDYNNPIIPRAEPSGFNFHVPFLTIVFRNSHIIHFAAEVFLILEKIFDERAKLENSSRNIIVLKGVAEEHNGRVTYAFGFSGFNRFKLSGKVMEEVEVIKAQFSTDPLPPPNRRPTVLSIKGRFPLWGRLRFAYLREFDILSFGRTPEGTDQPLRDYLSISNFKVNLSFQLNQDTNQVQNRRFSFDSTRMVTDTVNSGWRMKSLYEQFPLIFRGFEKSSGGTKTGYMPVSVPAKRAVLEGNYYSMKFDLNLGTLGDLSGSKPLTAGIMVGWNPEKEGIFVGLKLAGSTSDKKEIILQGLLKLSFGTIRFVVFDTGKILPSETDKQRADSAKLEREVGYMLNLKNIKLKFFVLTFPPIGQTEMTLFGDTRGDIQRVDRLLGWYAAYVKK